MKRDILYKHELVEVIIPAGSTLSKYYLPDLPNLRNVHLWNIEVFSSDEIPKSIISGNAVISPSLMKSAFLTLQSYNGKNFVYQRPFPLFKYIQNIFAIAANSLTEFYPRSFVGQKVNYPKSYVEIADTSLISGVAAQCILLSVEYSDIAAIEAKDRTAEFGNQS